MKKGGDVHNGKTVNCNQNNGRLGIDRSMTRQSKLFRVHESGNTMKDLLGNSKLGWDVNKKEVTYPYP